MKLSHCSIPFTGKKTLQDTFLFFIIKKHHFEKIYFELQIFLVDENNFHDSDLLFILILRTIFGTSYIKT